MIRGGITPLVLNLGIRCMQVLRFTPWLIYPLGKSCRPQNMRPELLDIEWWSFYNLAYSLVTVPIEITRQLTFNWACPYLGKGESTYFGLGISCVTQFRIICWGITPFLRYIQQHDCNHPSSPPLKLTEDSL